MIRNVNLARSIFSDIKAGTGRALKSTLHMHLNVGKALRNRYKPIKGAVLKDGISQAEDIGTISRISEDIKNAAKWSTSGMSESPAWKIGSNLASNIKAYKGVLGHGRRIIGSMGKSPSAWAWGGAIGAFGLTIGGVVGVHNGLSDQGYPIHNAQAMQPMYGSGPGYQTWAKGRGRPMSPNHLGTAGLTNSLYKTRHR